jgi:uncharacterized protein YjbJ (UPF0337 family)
MNKFTFKGTWNEVKGKLKQRYAELTDDDLTYAEGKEDELLGRLQKRTGRTQEELRREIEGYWARARRVPATPQGDISMASRRRFMKLRPRSLVAGGEPPTHWLEPLEEKDESREA